MRGGGAESYRYPARGVTDRDALRLGLACAAQLRARVSGFGGGTDQSAVEC